MTKSSKHWYPRYSGDYRAKTAGLSLVQHGAYTLLLDEYYNTGKSLDANASILHRICSALAPDEQEAINFILERFFIKTEKGYINKRAEEELAKRMDISEKRKEAANSRHAKDMQVGCKDGAIVPANAHTSTSTSTSTSIITTIPKDINVIEKSRAQEILNQFDIFWEEFPTNGRNKGSKKDAQVKFKIALNKSTFNEIMGGMNNYANYIKQSGQSNQDAFRWLEKERWREEYAITNRVEARKPTADDNWSAGSLQFLSESVE